MKIKILFVTKASGIGGTEKHLVDLILSLDLSKVDPSILCLSMDVYAKPLKQQRDLPVTIHQWALPDSFLAYWASFRELTPQIIVFVSGTPGTISWRAYLAAKLSGARRVFAIEHSIADPPPKERAGHGVVNSLARLGGWRARQRQKHILKMRVPGILSDRTICVCHAVRERLVNDYGYPAHKTMAIWNGVDIKRYSEYPPPSDVVRRTLKISPSQEVLVCVTRLDPVKGTDLLLRAMSIVSKEHPSCQCIIVGDGPSEAELRALATELNLSSSVIFVGFAEDVRPYLQAGDIFVLPSYKEGLTLALLEAMACGLPCVATRAGGNDEAIVHGHNGLIVPVGSAEELAEAIKYLLVHREERRVMAVNARKRVEECFDISETMAKIQDVLFG